MNNNDLVKKLLDKYAGVAITLVVLWFAIAYLC